MSAELFRVVTPTDALSKIFDALESTIGDERVPLDDALFRITAAPVYASEQSPSFSRSAMDGFAVHAADTYGASDGLPSHMSVHGEVRMGRSVAEPLSSGTARLIHTGGMMPPGADAVVMVEHTQTIDERAIEVTRPVAPGENVIQAGEDLAVGDLILPAGWRVRPQDIGVLAAVGIRELVVTRRPVIGLLATGDEIVDRTSEPAAGQVRDVNTSVLSALITEIGAVPKPYGIAPDDRSALTRLASKALSTCDMLVITAGSSVSARDLTADVIGDLGMPGVLAHGLTVKPGKPTIGAVCNGKPVFGLPGNPVSAIVVYGLLVRPTICKLLGSSEEDTRPRIRARLRRNVASQSGRIDYVPVTLHEHDEELWAEPIFGKSNLIYTLVRAAGLATIPMDAGGQPEGALVDVELL
jgi:molybdopterin molybdotransferase